MATYAEKRPAVFFDRDGVLNKDTGYVYRKEEYQWFPGAIETIKFFNDKEYFVFVVTNQSGVGRGYYCEQDVRTLHDWMNSQLAKAGAHIDAFYYCPHHPEAKLEKYRQICNCRKPGPGLIMQALTEWPVDIQQSFIIGDKSSDIEAGRSAGLGGYLFTGENLMDFIKTLIRENP